MNRSDFTTADHGSSEMDERELAVVEFLEAYEQLPKAVEPTVCGLDDPAPVLWWRTSSGFSLLPNPGDVPAQRDDIQRRLPGVATVAEQDHAPTRSRSAAPGFEECLKPRDVVPIGAGDANRQRDPTRVDQGMPLASIFLPGPSGCGRLTLGRGALSTSSGPCFVTSRRSLPSRRTPQDRPARVRRRTPSGATSDNGGAPSLHSQAVSSAATLIDIPCEHERSGLEGPPRVNGLASRARFALVPTTRRPLGTCRNQWCYPLPKDLRKLPESRSRHARPPGTDLR
jgi:hypothetical protein